MPKFDCRISLLRLTLVILFLTVVAAITALFFHGVTFHTPLILAALFGGYMAITIGANDAANNLAAAVGAKAISLGMALVIAAGLEAAGTLIAGDNVMHTLKGELIDPTLIGSQQDFVWVMLSALLAAAIWIHLATVLNSPISTTHAIVGGMVGAATTAGGLGVTHWSMLATIASSWIVTPLLGGLIAATFLYLIKQTLTYQTHMTRAAKRVVPILVAGMGWAFSVYLMHKGLNQIWNIDFISAVMSSLMVALGLYLILHPMVDQAADRLPQSKMAINTLFNIPLIFAAAILSFAHGTNDAANALGPITAIYEITQGFSVNELTPISLWILLLGALGLGLGIVLYGPRLIKVVGYEITELDQIRAYSITMAIAITTILASELSLPVSTTHVMVGAVLGVGFLREHLKKLDVQTREKIAHHLSGKNPSLINRFLDEFYGASFLQKRMMLKQLETHSEMGDLTKEEHKELHKLYRKELVKRSAIIRIVTAWALTLPATALLASLIFLLTQKLS